MSLHSYLVKYAVGAQYPVRFKLNKNGRFVFVANRAVVKKPKKPLHESKTYQRDQRLSEWLKKRNKQS